MRSLACRLAWAGLMAWCMTTTPRAGEVPEGYLGLRLRDIPGDHTIVSWILPGPLDGEGITSPELCRPDLVVAVDGTPMNADAFDAYVSSRPPGSTVEITWRRSNARGGAIPTELDHETERRTSTFTVVARDEWTGTIGRSERVPALALGAERLLDPRDAASPLGGAIAEADLGAPVDTLVGVLRARAARDADVNGLIRVWAGFDAPFRLPEIQSRVVAAAVEAIDDTLDVRPIDLALRLAAENLDTAQPAPRPGRGDGNPSPTVGTDATRAIASAPDAACRDLARAMDASDARVATALGAMAGDETFAGDVLAFLGVPGETFYIAGADAKPHIDVIRRSMDVDFDALVAALASLADPIGPDTRSAGTGGAAVDAVAGSEVVIDTAGVAVPDALADAVDGVLLAAIERGNGTWVVVGGPSANRYDLCRVAGVIDLGGDDRYEASGTRLGSRVVHDLGGDDLYGGSATQGPASALLGVSLVDDRAGDDRYEGERLSAAAAAFGVSVLVDRAGHDEYVGTDWSIGAACYGAGILIDLAGQDVYRSVFLSQGAGGPRGLGMIVDAAGRDLYRANGPMPSAYGTPAVYQSFSQAIGFGYRSYAAGGIGAICDLDGDDRYEAGEFAQGGAYYYGLGVLYDRRGRDLYYGNRYGQGFGVHQAIGALVDDAGDDTYWSMTAASQGAAWDMGVGLLLDRAGDDTYQCDGLGQGGAAHQAIAMLVDLAGTDRYSARGGATQGQSGQDHYHYDVTGVYSFSLLLDTGGTIDTYSRARPQDAVTPTGELDGDRPASASLHGLVVDR